MPPWASHVTTVGAQAETLELHGPFGNVFKRGCIGFRVQGLLSGVGLRDPEAGLVLGLGVYGSGFRGHSRGLVQGMYYTT